MAVNFCLGLWKKPKLVENVPILFELAKETWELGFHGRGDIICSLS